jgi:hypothetical protein
MVQSMVQTLYSLFLFESELNTDVVKVFDVCVRPVKVLVPCSLRVDSWLSTNCRPETWTISETVGGDNHILNMLFVAL